MKQQYDELETEERESSTSKLTRFFLVMSSEGYSLIVCVSDDIVDYVLRRLSEKRARRQVEKELEVLGAVIKRREKPKSTKYAQIHQFIQVEIAVLPFQEAA